MFTVEGMPVKFVGLLVLFGWCVVWCVFELTRPQDSRQRVSGVLHLVMAGVMLMMVADWTWSALTSVVPTPAFAAVFAASVVWFAVLAVGAFRGSEGRAGWHFVGHAAMFAAMAWHLSAMVVMTMAMAAGSHPEMSEMSSDGWMARARQPEGVLWYVALAGAPLAVYLLAASGLHAWELFSPPRGAAGTRARRTMRDATRPGGMADAAAIVGTQLEALGCHEPRPVGTLSYRLAALCGFAMNFGMFWMSTGLLSPVLPFLAGF